MSVGQSRQQVVVTIAVEQKANGASIHPVNRLPLGHIPMQGFQHKTIASQGNQNIGIVRFDVWIALLQQSARLLRLGRRTGHKCDFFIQFNPPGCRRSLASLALKVQAAPLNRWQSQEWLPERLLRKIRGLIGILVEGKI